MKIDAFYEFAAGYPEVMKAFPLDQQEREKLPRDYIISVIYTLVGKPFSDWVDQLVEERHEGVADKRELYIEMDAEIAEIYQQSKAVSTTNGSSFNLLKASAKRRRSKKQIEEEKRQEELKQAEIERKLAHLEQLKQANGGQDVPADSIKSARDMINALVNNGMVRFGPNGDVIPVTNFSEHQALKRQRMDDEQNAQNIQQELAQQRDQGPHVERRRVGQQLEPNQEMFDAQQQLPNVAQQPAQSEQDGSEQPGSSLVEHGSQQQQDGSQNRFEI